MLIHSSLSPEYQDTCKSSFLSLVGSPLQKSISRLHFPGATRLADPRNKFTGPWLSVVENIFVKEAADRVGRASRTRVSYCYR